MWGEVTLSCLTKWGPYFYEKNLAKIPYCCIFLFIFLYLIFFWGEGYNHIGSEMGGGQTYDIIIFGGDFGCNGSGISIIHAWSSEDSYVTFPRYLGGTKLRV